MDDLSLNEAALLVTDSVVVDNKPIAELLYRLSCSSPQTAMRAQPGQFIHLTFDHAGSILRRPFSIYAAPAPDVHIVYEVRGTVTRQMTSLRRGERVSMLGPVGNSFGALDATQAVFVAGGTGLASLHFLAEQIKPGILFFGAKSKSQVWGLPEFKKRGWQIIVSTDDGTAGVPGFVTKPFEKFLKNHCMENIKVYTCGPTPMIRAVAGLCRHYGVRGEASLENIMACGVGACQGCVIEVRDADTRYKRVCVDGPVFDVKMIL
jgi:dihydroorotate dehydrogenase electron transfer subunit